MIDTIEFRLHNVSHYPALVNVFDSEEGKLTTMARRSIKEGYGEKIPLTLFLLDYKEGVAIPIRKADKRKIESSNHDVVFYIDPNRDILIINGSIPKLFLGNNVIDLLPFDKNQSINNTNPYKLINWYLDLLPKVFQHIIDLIVKKQDISINWYDVEYYRIDLTFNQIFNSKDDALKYLEYQHQILKKYQTPYSNSRRRFNTTVEVKTDRYYAKIYHKGTEFRDKQRPEINKLNKLQKTGCINNLSSNSRLTFSEQEELQELADKTLRYEFTFRANYISYIYNGKVNKRWSKSFKRWKSLYYRIGDTVEKRAFLKDKKTLYIYADGTQSWKPLAYADMMPIPVKEMKYFVYCPEKKDIREYTDAEYAIHDDLYRVIGAFGQTRLKEWIEFMRKELTIVRRFTVVSPEFDYHVKYHPTIDGEARSLDIGSETPTQQRFSYTLFKAMLDEVKKFFVQYQIHEIHNDEKFMKKVEAFSEKKKTQSEAVKHFAMPYMTLTASSMYNTKAVQAEPKKARGIYKGSLLFLHKLLQEGKSWDDIKAECYFPHATYYRLKKKYEEVTGQTGNVAKQGTISVNKDFDSIFTEICSLSVYSKVGHFYLNANHVLLPVM